MKKLSQSIIILIVFFALASIAPAHADVAPPPPPYGADIYPNGVSTEVRMVAETVDMYIRGDVSQEYPDGYANVRAIFHMQNMGLKAENLEVFFPMNILHCDQDFFSLFELRSYPPIRDFHATINGVEKPVTIIYRKAEPGLETDPIDTDIPCWAHFPAIFLPGKEVIIQVDYIAPADVGRTEAGYRSGYISYSYILQTGAGWKDTIGSADIHIHMPYEINEINVTGYQPEQGMVQGRKVSWHMENFEPNGDTSITPSDISISILKPTKWKSIQSETQNVMLRPDDGEAWGRLGKAYKEAYLYPKGYRSGQAGEKIYQASVEAYQKAVTLKPNDAAWHAGFSEILCSKVIWDGVESFPDNPDVYFVPCVTHIKRALDLDPKQELANEMLDFLATWESQLSPHLLIDLSGSTPDYLVLTPQPHTITPTTKPTSTSTPIPPTVTPTQTSLPTLNPTSTPTTASTPMAFVISTETPVLPTPEKPSQPGLCGSAIFPGAIAVIVYLGRQGTSRKKSFLSSSRVPGRPGVL